MNKVCAVVDVFFPSGGEVLKVGVTPTETAKKDTEAEAEAEFIKVLVATPKR